MTILTPNEMHIPPNILAEDEQIRRHRGSVADNGKITSGLAQWNLPNGAIRAVLFARVAGVEIAEPLPTNFMGMDETARALARQQPSERLRRRIAEIMPEQVPNPFLQMRGNVLCPCESGKRFKHCCRKSQPETIDKADLADHEQFFREWDPVGWKRRNLKVVG